MARIFLSHSTTNNAEAIALRDWLESQGWDDVFLDLDPERGIKAGDRWQAALKRAAERCELVIFLVSPAWAASKWCLAEFLLAKNLNKRIFGVIVEAVPFADLPVEITAEWQLVDLTAGARDYQTTIKVPPADAPAEVAFAHDGLKRLRLGLARAGLDARYFAWPPESDPDRPPYRGLRPLEAEDAGIFFGRDGPVVLGLEQLRGLHEAPPPRMLVILGASGAGKSSFMRAGLWPRLARESEHFLPLPVLRPERAALTGETGLIAVLEQALKEAGVSRSRTDIRAAVTGGASSLKPLLSVLVESRMRSHGLEGESRKPPTLILPIDQAEELFLAEGADEAHALLTLLRDLLIHDAPPAHESVQYSPPPPRGEGLGVGGTDTTAPSSSPHPRPLPVKGRGETAPNSVEPALIALFTIRSDGYERLQTAPELEGLRQHTLSLPPMPQGAYADVIKGPARRLEGSKRSLKIEEALVDALLADIEAGGAKDSLPLLAFTLERLYREHGGDGDLRLSEYEELGRVKGSIEAAVERAFKAADADPKIPRDRDARLALLRRGLIPWLAGIDPDTGAPRRRVARLSEIPAEARPLIDHLVEQRLLATDVSKETGEKTIEPAHEALLRQWGLLQGWLTEDAALLTVLDGVKRAARDWAANAKNAAWLTHGMDRLKATEGLRRRSDLSGNLEPTDWDYLAACRKAQRRTKALIGALATSVVAIVGLAYAGMDATYLEGRINGIRNSMREAKLKPNDTFTECLINCPEMVVLPAGKFVMGSPKDLGRDDEQPQHEVTIDKLFIVSKFEVTFDQWDACVAGGGCSYQPDDGLLGFAFTGVQRPPVPVVNVNWEDVQQYLTWLSKKTGKTYRLLTAAEWEYAARAGSDKVYSWGDELYRDGQVMANCWGCGSKWDGVESAPVGSFAPNAFGLFDMHGNAAEWVEDCYASNYEGPPPDGSANSRGDCSSRILRGGSWNRDPDSICSACRRREFSDLRNNNYGFRVARTLDQ